MRTPNISSSLLFNSVPKYTSCVVSGSSVSSCTDSTSTYSTLRSITTSTTFTSCTWTSCPVSNDAGSAIHCIGGSTVLTIEDCSFISCSAAREGGAIHSSSIHTLDVKKTLFYKCFTTTTTEDRGSGAIWIYGIQHTLSLSEDTFISCTSKASGGASIIQSCTAAVNGADVINNCVYIDCKVTDTSPDGGGLAIWANDGLFGLKCCSFSSCHSEYDAGAIRYDFRIYQPRSYPFRFCFFYKNTAQLGNDIVTNYISDDVPPTLHCFTTATENSFYNTDSYQDSWLPQGSIYLGDSS